MRAQSKCTLAVLTVCCFFTGTLFSQVHALEKEMNRWCETAGSTTLEEMDQQMILSQGFLNGGASTETGAASVEVTDADAVGWLVLYHTFMFIYYGRQCLEILDPVPCRAMVQHLFWALFLGVLFEAF